MLLVLLFQKQQIEESLLFAEWWTNGKTRFIICSCKVVSDWLASAESRVYFATPLPSPDCFLRIRTVFLHHVYVELYPILGNKL